MNEEVILEQPESSDRLLNVVESRNYKRRLLTAVSDVPTKKWIRISETLFILFILLLNLYLIFPFFGHEDEVNVFSAPLVPFLASLLAVITPYSYAVRFWLLFFLLIFPLTYYYFVKEIAGRKLVAVFSTLLVSLPITVFWSFRVKSILEGDGATIASFTLIMLTCLILLNFLRKGKFKIAIFTSFGITLVALTSPMGLLIFLVFALILTFSEMLLGQGRLKFTRLMTVLVLAAGFSAFWYNPKFILLILDSSQGYIITRTFTKLIPPSFFLLPLLTIFGFLLFENQPQLQPLFLTAFLTICFGLVSLSGSLPFTSPSRFYSGFGVSLAFLLGILLVYLYDLIARSPRLDKLKIARSKRPILATALLGLVLVVIFFLILTNSRSFFETGGLELLDLTPQHKIGIWETRQQTSFLANIFGILLTGLTLLLIAFLSSKLKNNQRQ